MAQFDTETAAKAFARAKEAQHYTTKITRLMPDGIRTVWQVDWHVDHNTPL